MNSRMGLFGIALQGLSQAESQLNSAANAVVTAGTNSPSGANLDIVSLSSEVVALSTAQTQFELSLETVKTADQIEKSTVNLFA